MNIQSAQAGHINCLHRIPNTSSEGQSLAEKTKEIEWNKVKAHFVVKGTSFAVWCRSNNIEPGNFKKIYDGDWNGPKAKILLKKLEDELKVAA